MAKKTFFQKAQEALSLANLFNNKIKAVASLLDKGTALTPGEAKGIADDLLLTGKELQREMIEILGDVK